MTAVAVVGSGGPAEAAPTPDEVCTNQSTTVTVDGEPAGVIAETACVAVVKVESVSVIAGATQTNVTGAKNWAAVKGAGDVIIQATLAPNTDAAAAAVTWTGGTAVPGQPRQRKVSKTTSAHTTVTATAGSSSDHVDVWILFATLQVRSTNGTTTSALNNKAFPPGYGGNVLGELTDEDNGITVGEGLGKVEIAATLSPAGAGAVVQAGWDIKRWIVFKDFSNGALSSSSAGQDDTSLPQYKDLVPDPDDKIYDIDGPTVGNNFGVNHTKETYNNFTQWVTWNGDKASGDVTWHFQARVDDDLDPAHRNPDGSGNDDTVLIDVDSGTITIPGAAHFAPR